MREIPSWPLTCMWGEVAGMLDACGLPYEYEDASQMSAGLMCLFEEMCIAHCGLKEREMNGCCCGLASSVGSSASHRCLTRCQISSWKLGRRAQVRGEHAVLRYC